MAVTLTKVSTLNKDTYTLHGNTSFIIDYYDGYFTITFSPTVDTYNGEYHIHRIVNNQFIPVIYFDYFDIGIINYPIWKFTNYGLHSVSFPWSGDQLPYLTFDIQNKYNNTEFDIETTIINILDRQIDELLISEDKNSFMNKSYDIIDNMLLSVLKANIEYSTDLNVLCSLPNINKSKYKLLDNQYNTTQSINKIIK